MKRKVLVISRNLFLNLYRAGLKSYAEENTDLSIDLYELDYPKTKLSLIDKLRYKFDLNDFRKKYYEQVRNELCKIIEDYDEILFINLFFDKEYFIQGNLVELLKTKKTKIFFADSIRLFNEEIDFWEVFDKIYTFEYADIDYAKEKYDIDVTYNPIGTSYFLFDCNAENKDYDICFVGLPTKNRLEYLDHIAEYCYNKKKKIYISGHFWHWNNILNYYIGKLKFKYKHPILSKYVKNIYIQPNDLAKIYSKSKVVLNINVPHHKGFNQRNFDVMMCKSLLICSQQDANGIDVREGHDFIMCKDIEDMITKIDYYLDNEDEYKEIIDKAYATVCDKFLFKHTLDRIFKE